MVHHGLILKNCLRLQQKHINLLLIVDINGMSADVSFNLKMCLFQDLMFNSLLIYL